jgi:hypothetical protein
LMAKTVLPLAAVLLLVDILTKIAAQQFLPTGYFFTSTPAVSLHTVLHLRPEPLGSLAICLGWALAELVLFYLPFWRHPPRIVGIGMSMALAGVIGNMGEVALHGGAIDFIAVRAAADGFMVFNLADVMYTLAYVLLVGSILIWMARLLANTGRMIGLALLSNGARRDQATPNI